MEKLLPPDWMLHLIIIIMAWALVSSILIGIIVIVYTFIKEKK